MSPNVEKRRKPMLSFHAPSHTRSSVRNAKSRRRGPLEALLPRSPPGAREEPAAQAVLEPQHPLHGEGAVAAPALVACAPPEQERQVHRALAHHALAVDESAGGAVERVLDVEA